MARTCIRKSSEVLRLVSEGWTLKWSEGMHGHFWIQNGPGGEAHNVAYPAVARIRDQFEEDGGRSFPTTKFRLKTPEKTNAE